MLQKYKVFQVSILLLLPLSLQAQLITLPRRESTQERDCKCLSSNVVWEKPHKASSFTHSGVYIQLGLIWSEDSSSCWFNMCISTFLLYLCTAPSTAECQHCPGCLWAPVMHPVVVFTLPMASCAEIMVCCNLSECLQLNLEKQCPGFYE